VHPGWSQACILLGSVSVASGKGYRLTVHVQLFLVLRVSLHMTREISLAADGLVTNVARDGCLDRMDE